MHKKGHKPPMKEVMPKEEKMKGNDMLNDYGMELHKRSKKYHEDLAFQMRDWFKC